MPPDLVAEGVAEDGARDGDDDAESERHPALLREHTGDEQRGLTGDEQSDEGGGLQQAQREQEDVAPGIDGIAERVDRGLDHPVSPTRAAGRVDVSAAGRKAPCPSPGRGSALAKTALRSGAMKKLLLLLVLVALAAVAARKVRAV